MIKYSYTLKSGEVITKYKEFDMKKYNDEYYQNKKQHINERLECSCGLSYTRSNKWTHLHGRVHQLYERMTQQPKQELLAIYTKNEQNT